MRTRAWCAQSALLTGVLGSHGAAFGQLPDAGTAPAYVEPLALGVLAIVTGVVIYLAYGWQRRRTYAYLYRVSGSRWDWRRLLGRYRFRITADFCRLGRHPGNEVHIRDRSISRFHAYLVRHANGAFSIYDAGATNGLRVGYRHVQSSLLQEGDLVDLGNVRFKFTRLPRDYKVHGNTDMLDMPATRYDSRRRHEGRTDLSLPVRLYNDEFGWINGWIRNAGREGAYVETDAKLASRLPVDIVIPISEGMRRKWLRVSAEVVWSDARGAGVRYTDADAQSIDQLIGMAVSTDSTPAAGRTGSATLH